MSANKTGRVRIQILDRNNKIVRTLPKTFSVDTASEFMGKCRIGQPYRLIEVKPEEAKA